VPGVADPRQQRLEVGVVDPGQRLGAVRGGSARSSQPSSPISGTKRTPASLSSRY
jgi:hypothetical protein